MLAFGTMRARLSALLAAPRSPVKSRIVLLTLACFILYSATLITLLLAWYKLDTAVPFHWFDDSRGWLLVDKFGHFFAAFIECSILASIWRWTGLSRKQCIVIAATMALAAQSSYEIFDGFSDGYGASATDLLANVLGVAAVVLQFYFAKRLVLLSKFSFHPSLLAHLRPAFFGDTLIQQILKDYNGQTYWFTFDVNALTGSSVLPSWLYLTIGYGGDGMLGGDDNVWTDEDGVVHDYSHLARSSRLMISVDFDWSRISNKKLRALCHVFTYIKFPAPAFEINFIKGLRFHWIYF